MDSLSQIADVVIGVDTHVATHSAAAVDTRTGGVLAEVTVEAAPDGYEALVQFADQQSALRAWAIEGTGGHGAGLARHLACRGELVAELDRPERARRRNGAKSDPLDAIRAAREALSRGKLGTPRTTGERQALSVLLAARRSAVEAARIAQQQVFSLVIAAPEQLRSKLRGKSMLVMTRTAARLRLRAGWDVETRTTAAVLREPPPDRVPMIDAHSSGRCGPAYRLSPAVLLSFQPGPAAVRRSWRSSGPGIPNCPNATVSGRSSPPRCCAPGRIRDGSAPRRPSPCSAAQPRSP